MPHKGPGEITAVFALASKVEMLFSSPNLFPIAVLLARAHWPDGADNML